MPVTDRGQAAGYGLLGGRGGGAVLEVDRPPCR